MSTRQQHDMFERFFDEIDFPALEIKLTRSPQTAP